ncbi:hypothetical protein HBZS_100030 [Helicobacter bizzozeronii CCUG 35545]|nr:hypothetical protein HBZS_100030 [Helicobacter bizzozeronii CCUG 35545]
MLEGTLRGELLKSQKKALRKEGFFDGKFVWQGAMQCLCYFQNQ